MGTICEYPLDPLIEEHIWKIKILKTSYYDIMMELQQVILILIELLVIQIIILVDIIIVSMVYYIQVLLIIIEIKK